MKSKNLSIIDVMKKTGQWMPTKSVSSPSAQTSASCARRTEKIPNFFNFQTFCAKNPQLSRVERAVIEMQFLFGARISEILQITNADVSASGMVRIRAEKGSVDRVIRPIFEAEFWLNEAEQLLPLNRVFSRYYFYRLYKKHGLYGHFGSNKKASVTHYFRHIKGAEINQEWQDLELVKNALGHKSVRSAAYYGKKERK